jgi:RimJ/RimL family protein N-acetyltransferase
MPSLSGESLVTFRLKLIPATFSLMQAELGRREAFSRSLGARIPENWPPEILTDALALFFAQLKGDPKLTGWLSWYFVLQAKEEGPVLVGSGGFKGPPLPDGTVELGYSVFPQYQGRGYATEAVSALLLWAFSHNEVARVIAETALENRSSIRVLEKLGFTYIEQGSPARTMRFELPRKRYHAEGDA